MRYIESRRVSRDPKTKLLILEGAEDILDVL
jgi:hypothetical protein